MSHDLNISPNKNLTPSGQKQSLSLSTHMFTMLAACAGVAVGVVGSMGYVTANIHSQMSTDTAVLSRQIGSYKSAALYASSTDPTGDNTQCMGNNATSTSTSSGSGGSGGGGGGSVLSAQAAVTPNASAPGGGMGGGGLGSGGTTTNNTTNFVHKLVSGNFAPETATISNTGPDSTNKVLFQNTVDTTVTNTSTIGVTNNNPQTASSGSSSVTNNTTAGAATSGNATNTSNTTVTANVTN